MSGERWTLDGYGRLRCNGKVCGWVGSWAAAPSERAARMALFAKFLAAADADADAAARLRSLAAIYEQPLNRDATFTFTGRELAAMLKEGAE